MTLHELVTVLALALAVASVVVLVAHLGLAGAMFGGAFYASVTTIVVVSLPHLPARWDFPVLLPVWVRRRLQEARDREVFR